jgi:hypothetical protein
MSDITWKEFLWEVAKEIQSEPEEPLVVSGVVLTCIIILLTGFLISWSVAGKIILVIILFAVLALISILVFILINSILGVIKGNL